MGLLSQERALQCDVVPQIVAAISSIAGREMSAEELDLRALPDDELVQQMHDERAGSAVLPRTRRSALRRRQVCRSS